MIVPGIKNAAAGCIIYMLVVVLVFVHILSGLYWPLTAIAFLAFW